MKPTIVAQRDGRRTYSTSGLTCEDLFWRLRDRNLIDSFGLRYLQQKVSFGPDFWIHRETIVRDILMELLGLHYQQTNVIYKQTIQALIERIDEHKELL